MKEFIEDNNEAAFEAGETLKCRSLSVSKKEGFFLEGSMFVKYASEGKTFLNTRII